MRKFTKIASVIAVIFTVIGIGCLTAAFSMGLTVGTLNEALRLEQFSFFGKNKWEGNSSENFHSQFTDLEIEMGAGTLEIVYEDVEQVQIKRKNTSNFKAYVDEGVLYIQSGRKAGEIKIVIPREKSFREVELELGAGEATVEGLLAERVHIELGAGEADFKKLETTHLEAEVGAGELYIELIGKENDYGYDIECGIGEIQVGDHSYSGIGETQKNMSSGTNKVIDLECGIGEIQISFME